MAVRCDRHPSRDPLPAAGQSPTRSGTGPTSARDFEPDPTRSTESPRYDPPRQIFEPVNDTLMGQLDLARYQAT